MNQEIAECEGHFRDSRDFILSLKFAVHLVTIKCPYFCYEYKQKECKNDEKLQVYIWKHIPILME